MQSPLRSQGSGWVGLAGAAGALVSVLILSSGCPGTLDPSLFPGSGAGGTTGAGGSGNPTGGSNCPPPAADPNCAGNNSGATVVTTSCATIGCHTPSSAKFAGSLDLTINSGIA